MENTHPPFSQSLDGIDKLIANELLERKRFAITDTQADELLKIVKEIQETKKSPPTWLEVH